MATDIIPFNYEGNTVRTIKTNGETWFIAADVARVLEIGNVSQALTRLDNDERALISNEGKELNAVSEAGLYALILGSRKPQAKPFRRWVTHEVLPAIRSKGGYLTPEATEKALTDPDFIIQLATSLKNERTKRAQLEAQAALNAPKVLFANSVATSHTTILVGELAKILRGNGVNIGGTRLFAWMRENGYLISRKGTDWNMPTQKAMELGLFKIKETAVTHSDGHVTLTRTPKVTGKGQQYFIQKFLNAKEVAA